MGKAEFVLINILILSYFKVWNLSYEYSKFGNCPTPILDFVLQIFKVWNLSYSYFGICPTNIQSL